MGLQEKKWIETGKKEWIPSFEAEVKDRAGISVKFEPDWATFESSSLALEKVQHQGFQYVANALAWVGRDDAGKEAIGNIKKVVLRNVDDAAKNKLTVNGDVLTLEAAWGKDAYMSDPEVTEALEKAL